MSYLQFHPSRCGMHLISPSLSFSWSISVWGSKGCTTMIVSLRIHVRNSLTSHFHTVATSRLAFDILACGSCILFPRWVSALWCTYILTSSWWRQIGIFCGSQSCYHSVCLHNPTRPLRSSYLATNSSLQAMIVQFVMFIGTVIICFSGLMFTLWILGNASSLQSATLTKNFESTARDKSIDHNHEPWTLGSLAWYCVHIWLGSGAIIFSQADSFHPIFGPLLVTVFALFSSTLLVTSWVQGSMVSAFAAPVQGLFTILTLDVSFNSFDLYLIQYRRQDWFQCISGGKSQVSTLFHLWLIHCSNLHSICFNLWFRPLKGTSLLS